MGRLKRAQKLARQLEVKPAPKPVAVGVVAQRIVGCFCPICGKTIHENRPVKVGYTKVGETGYFQSIRWDKDKAFGLVFEASGRGSLSRWEYILPEDCPEFFGEVKQRLINALQEWLDKGWLTQSELATLRTSKTSKE